MPSAAPRISVIVCTHNRRDQLLELLHGLERQTVPPEDFEVIIAADACTDDTAGAVRAAAPSLRYRHHLLRLSARRAASARNAGARSARGAVLLFLDDDMVPAPGLLAAHARGQESADVVIGYARPSLPAKPTHWQLRAALWWEDRFTAMARPDHLFGYRDLFTGNVSIRRDVFTAVGGFDERLGRLEDYELGIRLIAAGARFAFRRDALSLHRDAGDGDRWLARLGTEGATFVELERKHPRMRGQFHTEPPVGTWSDRIRRLAQAYPRVARLLVPFVHDVVLTTLERLKIRGLWERGLAAMGDLAYWSGVARAEAAGGPRPVPPPDPVPPLTIRTGQDGTVPEGIVIPAGTREADILFEDVPVGRIISAPGEEPLTARHVRRPLGNLTPDPWVSTPFTRSLTSARADCPAPCALATMDLADGSGVPVVPPDLRSLCLLLTFDGRPVGFFPLRREDRERKDPRSLREEILLGARGALRAAAAERYLSRTRALQETGGGSAVVVITGNTLEDRARETLAALRGQNVPPLRTVTVADARVPAGEESVVVFLSAGMIPDAAFLARILPVFEDPSAGAVLPLVLPGGVLGPLGRIPPWLGGAGPDSGLDPFLLTPETGFRERLADARLRHGFGALAVRRSLLGNGPALCDGSHIRIAEKAVSDGYTLRYEPSAMIWTADDTDPSRSAPAAQARGADRRYLLRLAAGGTTAAAARVVVRGYLRAVQLRDRRYAAAGRAEALGLVGGGFPAREANTISEQGTGESR